MSTLDKLVGLWYMPNWKGRPEEPTYWNAFPWQRLKQFFGIDREPLQGYYAEGDQAVMDTAIRQAVGSGVDFFAFDTYFDHSTRELVGDHAIKAFMASKVDGMQFCIALETENAEVPVKCMGDLEAFADRIGDITDHPKYLKFNGRPVVFNIKSYHMHTVITAACDYMGLAADCPNREAQAHAKVLQLIRERSGKNLYFVAGFEAHPHWTWQAKLSGYEGFSMYNLFSESYLSPPGPRATCYAELVRIYAKAWAWLASSLKAQGLDLWVPFTMGWDNTTLLNPDPIGIAADDLPSYKAHLAALRDFLDNNDTAVGAIGDAWNEHTEGSVMEPTKKLGRTLLYWFAKLLKRR